jgi:2-(1,2-epoxy-1,2-dihydrophenyl)acetyl-CoA isomerase
MDSESGSSTLSLSYRGPVAIVTLNRPDRGNGLNGALKTALRDVLDAVGADDEVRAVVLIGAGRSFCVGQDLEEHAEALAADPTSAFATVAESITTRS